MESFKVSIDNLGGDRIIHQFEREEGEILSDSEKPESSEDIQRILLDLQSPLETNILKSYSVLVEICKNDYTFPRDYFDLVIEHTLSSNITIAEHSQGFLLSLFRKHPNEAQIFCEIDAIEYFQKLIQSPFNSKTVPFIITAFTKKLMDTSGFIQNFFDIFFSNFDHDIGTPEFFYRLDFLRIYIYHFTEFNENLYISCQNLILSFFPKTKSFDRDLLLIFLAIISKCMNLEVDEKWLETFIGNNYVSDLLDFYSDDDDDINLHIAWSLAGISGSSKKISNILFKMHIFEFFGRNFLKTNDDQIKSLFIRTTSNLLMTDDSTEMNYINGFTNSQFFNDILSVFDDSILKLKKEIIILISYLVKRLDRSFVKPFVELGLIRLYIDALYLDESLKIKKFAIHAIAHIIRIYELLNPSEEGQVLSNDDSLAQLIEIILGDKDLINAIDYYVDEYAQTEPTKEQMEAEHIRHALYHFNNYDQYV